MPRGSPAGMAGTEGGGVTDWDLDAHLATDSLRRIVDGVRPLCRQVACQRDITMWQLMALDHAINGVRWVYADFDGRHPDRGLPMPRWVAGLIDVWQWVNRRLASGCPAETGEPDE